MAETTAFDAVGNVISHTDFNGDTITYEYDLNDRLTRRVFPDGTSEEFTYTATGKRQTVTDSRGVTCAGYLTHPLKRKGFPTYLDRIWGG